VSVSLEPRPHALRELRLYLFDILPCRHTPIFAPMTDTSSPPRSARIVATRRSSDQLARRPKRSCGRLVAGQHIAGQSLGDECSSDVLVMVPGWLTPLAAVSG
jgi:hypothetical protein